MYQIYHPWHWLTYGQNGVMIGVLLSLLVNAFSVFVLFKTLGIVNRQSVAADRQASAAEAQAAVATASAALIELQLTAARREIAEGEAARKADSDVLEALSDPNLWTGPLPITGSGDVGVRADELAEHLSRDLYEIDLSLERLEDRGRVRDAGGNLADSTSRWTIVRR